MKKLTLWLLLAALLAPVAFAQIDITGSYLGTSGDVLPSEQVQIRAGGDYYLWGSYSRHSQLEQTQRLGTARVFGAGIGTRREFSTFSLFAEAGIGYLDTKYSNRVLREIVYYNFEPIFGEPPFLPDGGWWSLTSIYEPEPMAIMLKVGGHYRLTSSVSLEIGYQYFATDVYFSMWNPDLNGGPDPSNLDACACLWEGQKSIDASGGFVGLKYRF